MTVQIFRPDSFILVFSCLAQAEGDRPRGSRPGFPMGTKKPFVPMEMKEKPALGALAASFGKGLAPLEALDGCLSNPGGSATSRSTSASVDADVDLDVSSFVFTYVIFRKWDEHTKVGWLPEK